MSLELLLAFITFASVATITPGPNNLMLMSSGTVFGFRRTLPHILGVVLGLALLLGSMILGLGMLIERVPALARAVQFAGSAWLAWLGIRLFWGAITSGDTDREAAGKSSGRPLRALEAVLFQWANPKAIALTASCAAAFASLSTSVAMRLVVMIFIYSLSALLASLLWTIVGSTLAHLLSSGQSGRVAQIIMGLLFIATSVGLLIM